MIAFLINELDIRGGTHKQFLKLLDYVASQTNEFFIVTKTVDYNKTYPGFKKYQDKIRIFHQRSINHNVLRRIISYYSEVRNLRSLLSDADIINIHDQGYELYYPAFNNKKIIWQVNDLPTCYRVGCTKSLKANWKSNIQKLVVSRFGKIVEKFTVNVSKNKDRIRSIFNRDADVLYCGIEPLNITRDLQKTLERFKANSINILSSGVFFPYRNYETQVRVIKKLVQSGIDVKLNIIGDTSRHKEYYTKILNQISEYGLDKHINICGQVDEKEFKELHKESDIFLFINIDQSWGLAVFEAMSCGLPVIISESVGATEILKDQENALFVNPENVDQIVKCIIDLMHSPQLYTQLYNTGKLFHKNFTWNKAYAEPMYRILSGKE